MRSADSTAWFRARLAACLCAVLLAPSVSQAQGKPARVRAVEVAPGITMLKGQGGNVGVFSGADGVMLVDDQYAYQSAPIRRALDALSAGPVRFLLNTHWHSDHTGGNEAFAARGALIFAHENVRQRMSVEQFMAALERSVPPAPEAALPVVTFDSELRFHWNGDEVHAMHVASAHTDGDAIVRFHGANVLHTGDVYFENGYPFVDLSSGGSIDGLIAAVDRLLALADEDTAILPGHGDLSDRAELAEYRDMLRAARERVLRALAAGQDADALVASAPLADLDARWGQGFVSSESFLRTLHASLAPRPE